MIKSVSGTVAQAAIWQWVGSANTGSREISEGGVVFGWNSGSKTEWVVPLGIVMEHQYKGCRKNKRKILWLIGGFGCGRWDD